MAVQAMSKTPRALAARLNRDLYSSLDVAFMPSSRPYGPDNPDQKTVPMKPEIR
jgi:hypothetical protein